MLNKLLSIFKPNKQILTNENDMIALKMLLNVIKYDATTNTMIMNIPCNLIINTEGSQLNVSKNGHIVHVAECIHLNPPVTKQTIINISKSGKSYDDMMSPLSKLIEDSNGYN